MLSKTNFSVKKLYLKCNIVFDGQGSKGNNL